jgi:xanthine dehydrogenase small subunit
VQEAIVRCQGTQCGFCTPGSSSRCAACSTARDTRRESLRAGLVGNLCRCTGYDSIIKAGLAVTPQQTTRIAELYPPDSMLAELREHATQPVHVKTPTREFFKPVTVAQAVEFKAANPTCVLIAAGPTSACRSTRARATRRPSCRSADCPELHSITADGEVITAGRPRHAGRCRGLDEGPLPRAVEDARPPRLAAHPQRRDPRRQHRQRFADRRFDAGAVRASTPRSS